jgi:hypothetical protein
MEKKFGDLLDGEERAAVEILEEHGWIFLSGIEVDKAIPEGEKYPDYVSGGQYAMGALRRPGSVKAKLPPDKKSSKKGRGKKS